ncbi:alpha/beta fold hydrolase [Methylocella silvestris]|uniref:Alpha/beta hydrolase n=1 Tax=Methylocella silvestris TaxID=199596 RepID=A0A2J7TMA0_METSI|nr:alpha/beta hydrolase [Methylocella silvestris]PNG27884.1 alpha/beta hydrolase [Methylocella silvestris]
MTDRSVGDAGRDKGAADAVEGGAGAGLCPPGAIVTRIRTADRAALRVARWSCGDVCAGTVVVLPGRAEFIEKYYEVAAELLARNFDVVVMDWRGQGGSSRQAGNPVKGHIGNFGAYQRDLDALRAEILEPYGRLPFFALGHSMAGAILLEQAHAGRSFFERIALTAPMIDLPKLRYARPVRGLTRGLCLTGFSRVFAPGAGGATPYLTRPFAGNVLTSDPVRYARMAAYIAASPELAIGGPTIGWASAAFRQMRRFEDGEYPRRILTPTLIVAAGADAVVDTPAIEAFASRLKAGRCITLRRARHEILIERDPVRAQFWAAFDAFIPGSLKGTDPFATSLSAPLS